MSAAGKSGVQRHLTIAFPVKSPADAKALAEELPPLMADFAKVQDTLGIVHYSRFVVLGDNKTLLFLADIDGDADNLIEALAKSAGPVFDAIFGHVENPPPTPIASKSHAFFEWVTRHTAKPLTIYSACGNSSVQDIKSLARSAGITGSTEQRPLLNYLHIESGLKALTLEDLVLRATRSKMREGADSIGTLHSRSTSRTSQRKSGRFSTLFLNLSVTRRQPQWRKTPTHSLSGYWQTTSSPSGYTAPIQAWRSKTLKPSSPTLNRGLLRFNR